MANLLFKFNMIALALLAASCAAAPNSMAASVGESRSTADAAVVPVDFDASSALPLSPPVSQPESVSPPDSGTVTPNSPEVVAPSLVPLPGVLSLPAVEQLALANNPTVAQAEARLCALRGKWLQVGLPPNPTVGYMGSEIGSEGTAGQQGGFAGQEFVTAHKLQRNRAIVSAEIRAAEQQLATIIRRVQTDVRIRYYGALLAQQRLKLAADLVHISAEATETSKSLIEAAEIPLAGLLQTEVQLENAKLLQRTSENEFEQSWRQIQTLLGDSFFPPQSLEGDINVLPALLDFEDQLAQVQQASPEVAEAIAEVERTRRVLSRERVEAVPNVSTQLSVQYDNASKETIAGVQIGIPLPLWNRNQGGIRQARAEVCRATRNVDRVERNLQQRLVDAFRQYSDARVTAVTYAGEILPRAERTLELVRQGYAQGEVGYLDLLTAQRTFSQTNLAYLASLGSLWQSYLRIEGLLLEGSLEASIQ